MHTIYTLVVSPHDIELYYLPLHTGGTIVHVLYHGGSHYLGLLVPPYSSRIHRFCSGDLESASCERVGRPIIERDRSNDLLTLQIVFFASNLKSPCCFYMDIWRRDTMMFSLAPTNHSTMIILCKRSPSNLNASRKMPTKEKIPESRRPASLCIGVSSPQLPRYST